MKSQTTIRVSLTPVPASRPRVGRWGTYYSKRYKQWMIDAAALLPISKAPPLDTPLTLAVIFAIPRSKHSKLITPVGDGDNYEKAIFDLLQKQGYIADDRLITTCVWRKRFLPWGKDGYISITMTKETEEIDL